MFKEIKYDHQFPNPLNYSWMNIDSLFMMSPDDYPKIKPLLKQIQSWDRKASADSYGAGAYGILYLKLRKYYRILPEPKVFTKSILKKALIETNQHMIKYFGKSQVKLGTFQKLVRGDKELPVFGLPDVVTSMGSIPYKGGKTRVVSGESYIELVKFSKYGVEIESIISYGSSDDIGKSLNFDGENWSVSQYNWSILYESQSVNVIEKTLETTGSWSSDITDL
mgnify:CR=1 FL=1